LRHGARPDAVKVRFSSHCGWSARAGPTTADEQFFHVKIMDGYPVKLEVASPDNAEVFSKEEATGRFTCFDIEAVDFAIMGGLFEFVIKSRSHPRSSRAWTAIEMIYVTVFFEVNERDWLVEIIDRH
jgi:hypothetical protein